MKILVFDTETNGLPSRALRASRQSISRSEYHLGMPLAVQISWILYDVERKFIDAIYDYVIKVPRTVELNEESISIHGITRSIMNRHGVDIKEVLEEFSECSRQCDKLVAHNIKFDFEVIMGECLRNGIDPRKLFNKCTYIDKEEHREYCESYLESMCYLNEEKEENRRKKYSDPKEVQNRRYVYESIGRVCTMYRYTDFCDLYRINHLNNRCRKPPKLCELYEKLFGYQPENTHNSIVDVLCTLRCYMKKEYDYDIKSDLENDELLSEYDTYSDLVEAIEGL